MRAVNYVDDVLSDVWRLLLTTYLPIESALALMSTCRKLHGIVRDEQAFWRARVRRDMPLITWFPPEIPCWKSFYRRRFEKIPALIKGHCVLVDVSGTEVILNILDESPFGPYLTSRVIYGRISENVWNNAKEIIFLGIDGRPAIAHVTHTGVGGCDFQLETGLEIAFTDDNINVLLVKNAKAITWPEFGVNVYDEAGDDIDLCCRFFYERGLVPFT
uniref:F-box domain-containing protein n=1 Tax=viral metagenome TaxID=1070528 RepID=A0A6C0BPL0_9ZZZZ